jgi:hypothetical protein
MGRFYKHGRDLQIEQSFEQMHNKSWSLCKSAGEVQVFATRKSVNLDGNSSLSSEVIHQVKLNADKLNKPGRDVNAFLTGTSLFVAAVLFPVSNSAKIIFLVAALVICFLAEIRFRQLHKNFV